MSIILKNDSTPRMIESLGLWVEADEEVNLLDRGYHIDELSSADDLITLINNETVVINDGTIDLSVADALKHIRVETEYEDDEEEADIYATKKFAIAMSISLGG